MPAMGQLFAAVTMLFDPGWRAIQFALDLRKMPENYKVNIKLISLSKLRLIKINTPWLIKVYNRHCQFNLWRARESQAG
jgi:hypothetical protein